MNVKACLYVGKEQVPNEMHFQKALFKRMCARARWRRPLSLCELSRNAVRRSLGGWQFLSRAKALVLDARLFHFLVLPAPVDTPDALEVCERFILSDAFCGARNGYIVHSICLLNFDQHFSNFSRKFPNHVIFIQTN